MKKLFFILGVCVIALADVYGQQVPLYSQYMYNPYLYNPARTGADGRINVYGLYRRQFAGFANGPETRAVTFDMAVAKDKAGIGAYFFNDVTNIFRRNAGYFSYAYHLNFKGAHRLSIGLSAGVQNVRIDQEKIVVRDRDDYLLMSQANRNTFFDASVGVNYAWKGLNVGVAVPSVFGTDLDYLTEGGQSGYSTQRHYLANASYAVKLAQDKFTIEPQVMFRTTESFNFQFDAGVNLMYKDWIWINSMYRYDYAVTVGGGFKVHDLIKIGYAYDIPLNEMKSYNNGSHELLVGLTFRKKKKGDEQDSTLMKRLAQQDSLINDLKGDVDSLATTVDSVSGRLDSLQADFDSGADLQISNEQLDSLTQRLNELEEKYGKAIDSLSKKSGAGKTKTTKNNTSELDEERTRIVDENDLEYKRGAQLGDYFLVVGSFRIEQNSYNFEEQLIKEKLDAGVVYDKRRKWYYVYLSKPESKKEGLEQLYKFREENPRFHDAWIHIMSKTVKE
ncbi:MAG: PorP/SprF family type IX secretion system membrane protein [Chitinophagales bacterium]|nr:PorP/SprF family type IX secretion system membrane protein [Chitinophagales bacterium]